MKKAKLLASIISLCFSLAVLTFGVFAANQVNYLISGNISYIVSDAYVEVVTKVYQSTAQPDNKQDLAVAAADVASDGTIASATTAQVGDTVSLNTLNTTPADPYNPLGSENVTINFGSKFGVSAGKVIEGTNYDLMSVYVIASIRNLASTNVYIVPSVVVKNSGTPVEPADYNIVEYMSNGYSVVGQDDTVTVFLAYTISEITQNVGSLTFDFTMNIHQGNYTPSANASQLKWDKTQGFWFVTMGTKTVSTTNYSVRWRLYSIDNGATRYEHGVTASAGVYAKPAMPIGRGVFVLEDAATMTSDSAGYQVSTRTGIADGKAMNQYVANDGTPEGQYYRGIDSFTINENVAGQGVRALPNDYFGSEIFEYLANTSTGGYLEYLGIDGASDSVYTAITARTQADLGKDMSITGAYNGSLSSISTTINHTSNITRGVSKLWLLSAREICAISGVSPNRFSTDKANMIWANGGGDFEGSYWLRSHVPGNDTDNGLFITGDGTCYGDFAYDAWGGAVRAAFNLAL